MANPPPARPWSRLASLRPVPTPAPAPQSRPPLALPTFRTASAPPSPQTQPSQPSEPTAAPPRRVPTVTAAQFLGAAGRASAPSSPAQKVPAPSSASLPSSPFLKASQAPANTSTLDNNASATKSSPQRTRPSVQSTVQSPKLKLITPPPSSLALPPSQLKVNPEIEPKIPVQEETKTVLVQKTIEKPNQWLNVNGALQKESSETKKQGIGHHEKQVTTSKENENKGKGIHKKLWDSEESGIRAITLAGENRGAYMEIIQSSKKPNYLHKNGNSKIKAYDHESKSSGSGEGNANREDKSQKQRNQRTLSSPPMTTYRNSNVQCVNNSLLYHTSCTHHDPGVHLTLSVKPFGEGFHLKERVDGQHN